jgi:Flp pilus assembly pilin Flp
LLRDHRGTVTVEYVVVLTLVSLGVVAAMVGLGVPLVRTYLSQTAWLIAPIP